jgi:hypothetical protein
VSTDRRAVLNRRFVVDERLGARGAPWRQALVANIPRRTRMMAARGRVRD